ncbi:hypothetical protein OG21DRAFT_1454107 [Imleria badia]|nr:hypothetical protein OG21DRAFT_1454107 [Imleria badia]
MWSACPWCLTMASSSIGTPSNTLRCHPLIVPNRVRHKSGSVDAVRSYKVDDSAAWLAGHGNEVSTRIGSGTSAANAIVIDSDEDMTAISSLSRTDTPRELPMDHDTSLNKDVINYSDSEIQLLRSENKAEDEQEDSPLPLPADVSDPPSSRALTREEDATALSGLRSDGFEVMTSDSEADGADEEVNAAEDMDGSRVSARHAKPPSFSSLQPIRKLLARRKRRGDPGLDAPPERTIVSPGVSKKQGGREFHEEAPSITSSEGEDELHCPASDPQLKRVPLPKTDHGRARRLVMPESADLPLVAVTMRGDCHFIERKKKYRISGYSLPNPGVFRHVGDVCMVGNTAVLGCDKGPHQISFLSLARKPQMIDITWSPHSSGPRYQDTQKRGVSRLATIHAEDGHIKFLSGGYDGTIHEWTAAIEKLNEPRSRKVVSHGACIMALAYRDRDRSVMASAHKTLHITDLNRCKTMTHPFSNDIQQIHIHPQAAYVTLLEVRHLDRQIQLYDNRKGDFNGEPCLSFGHRNPNGKFSGAHTRGSVHLVHFAMASEDGGVLLWDFRNSKRAVIERRFQQAERVVHTIFADTDIATFGQGVVTFFEDYLTR